MYSKRSNVANKTPETLKYANNIRERKRTLEGVITCNQRLANQRAQICIPKEVCKLRNKKTRRCSQFVKSSCYLLNQNLQNMSSSNSPEKQDPKLPSTIVNTSTQTGNVNLNLVVKRVQGQPQSVSSDSDIEVIPPEKLIPKAVRQRN